MKTSSAAKQKKHAANQEEMLQIQKGTFFDLRQKILPQRRSRYIYVYIYMRRFDEAQI